MFSMDSAHSILFKEKSFRTCMMWSTFMGLGFRLNSGGQGACPADNPTARRRDKASRVPWTSR